MLKANNNNPMSKVEKEKAIDLLMSNRIHYENGYIRRARGENTLDSYIFHMSEIRNLHILRVAENSISIQIDLKSGNEKFTFNVIDNSPKYTQGLGWSIDYINDVVQLAKAILDLRDASLGLNKANYSERCFDTTI